VADSFDLTYNVGNGAWTVVGLPAFTTPGSLPSGYQLAFYIDGGAGNCSTIGTQVANTGVILPGATKLYCAQVTIPAGATAGFYDLYFRAVSPTTVTATTGSSADVKHDRLSVNTTRSVTITPNNSGQIFPGGSIAYCQTVTNAGNVAETAVTISNVNSQGSPWPANATIYRDTNNNCVLDAAETAVNLVNGDSGPFTSGLTLTAGATAALQNTLAPGSSQNYIIVVQAPNTAAAGTVNVTTVTVTPTPGPLNGVAAPAAVSATDTTTVVVGQVTLVKTQLADASCTQTMSLANLGTTLALSYSASQISAAAPGSCIIYQVVATNIGTQAVTGVQINDTTPPNTTCYASAGTWGFSSAGVVTVSPSTSACTPATTAAASLSTPILGTLAPNATMTLYFRVRINP
jgi:uncharacterized repeat protein (TIGR01451 family)